MLWRVELELFIDGGQNDLLVPQREGQSAGEPFLRFSGKVKRRSLASLWPFNPSRVVPSVPWSRETHRAQVGRVDIMRNEITPVAPRRVKQGLETGEDLFDQVGNGVDWAKTISLHRETSSQDTEGEGRANIGAESDRMGTLNVDKSVFS